MGIWFTISSSKMISVVISYCSNDKCFIKPLIEQCKVFSNEVLVLSCSHFFNGHKDHNLEDLSHLGVSHYIFGYLPDQIPDGNLMNNFLMEVGLQHNSIINFKCHWYFREPIFRARNSEVCGLLAHRSLLTENLFFTPLERWSYKLYNIPSMENAEYNGLIMMHHFS